MVSIKKKFIKANKELFSLLDRPEQTPNIKERIKLLMSQLNTYKEYLEPVQPGVGSSGTTETLQSPDTGYHIAARALFTSPSSTSHLDRSHDMHRQASTPRSESREGGKDEDHSDVVDMDAFPRARHVTSMGTLLCTFLVNDNGLPLKQSRLPGSDLFYGHVESKALSIFGETLRMR